MSERARTGYPYADRTETHDDLAMGPVPDPYRLLEDAEDPRTRTWLTEQAELFQRARSGWGSVDCFAASMDRLTAFDLMSSPRLCGDRAFFTSRAVGAEHTALLVQEAGGCRTLVDPHVMDPSGKTTLGSWAPSRDGKLVAYQVAEGGREEFDLYVLDVDECTNIDGPISGCRYSSVAWLPGGDAFYVVRRNEGADRLGIYLHQVGEPVGTEMEVFGDGFDETAELDVVLGPDGRLLVVLVSDGLSASNQVWWADLTHTSAAGPTLRPLGALSEGWSSVWPGRDGTLYILTDDAAPRGRLVAVQPTQDPPLSRTLISEEPGAVLESFALLDGEHLEQPLLLGLSAVDGNNRIDRYDLRTGQALGPLPLPGTGIVSELTFREDGGHQAWFTYSDRETPETVYEFDARSGAHRPWRGAQHVGAGKMTFWQESFPSTDGVQVRLLMAKPADACGPLPTILQGYGAFGQPQVADYYAAATAWVERGGLFAVACVRGGGELGEHWHQAGARENKQQGIDDLLAAASYLTDAGHTPPGRLGAFGQSAGGLLVAAAMTQRPDLFAAVACTSALLDMARYELTGLGAYWSEEFGSREVPTELEWLLGYCPYHRVRAGSPYPAVLLTALDQDTRVDPLHTRKMCAALQHATAAPMDQSPVLLRYETGVGHGERSRGGRLAYFADVLAFFDHHLSEH